MISKAEEQKLVYRALKGDQNAFQSLYDHHIDLLFRFLNQFSQNRFEVQEWTQRAFIKAFTRLYTFKMNSRFKTWLFTIGLNEMRTDMRTGFEFVELSNIDNTHEFDETPEETEPENWNKAKEAIRELSPEKRMVLLLHIAEGYSHQEIGEILSIKEGTSRIILHRAKKELKTKIKHG